MARQTKADLYDRVAELEAALRETLASHHDFIECAERDDGTPDVAWSRRIHERAEQTLHRAASPQMPGRAGT